MTRRSVLVPLGLMLVSSLLSLSATTLAAPGPTREQSHVVGLRASAATGIRGPASTLSAADRRASVRSVHQVIRRLQVELGFHATHHYAHALTGFAASLTDEQVEALWHDPRVSAITPDRKVELAAEVVPNGVLRVHAEPPLVSGPVDVDVAVIDTGLSQLRTDELDIRQGHNCVPSDPDDPDSPIVASDWGDIHGHGTHVAGIVGALDNDVGIVGVAPGARIWPARVFAIIGGQAQGQTAWITCAIDWVASLTEPIPGDPEGDLRPIIEVVNMSLSGGGRDRPCDQEIGPDANLDHVAICASTAAGTTYVVAAGNKGRDIDTPTADLLPAAFDEVIAVSALSDTDGRSGGLGGACSGADDTFATYSNFGAEIDLIAPGSCFLSLGRAAGSVATMSGTSMASPAVAGAAAVYLQQRPELAGDPQASEAVREALRASATLDWGSGSDPDGDADRLLDVSRLLATDPAIDLWAAPAQATVGSGAAVTSHAVDVSRAGGFAGPVDLSVSGLPSGVTASFETDPLSGVDGIETTLDVSIAANAPSGLHELVVHADAAGDLHAQASVMLMIDHQAPTLVGPHAGFALGGTPLTLSAPLRLTWSGSDDLSGLESYVLRQRAGGGSWLTVTPPGTLPTSATRVVQLDRDYEFLLRASDRAGNHTEMQTPTLVPTVRQSTDARVTIGPGWRLADAPDASVSSLHRSKRVGSKLTFAFTGRSVAWVAPVGPRQGLARVRVDGVSHGMVDLSALAKAPRRLVFVADWEVEGAHTIRIIVRGGASPRSVGVDAFLVLRG